LALGDDADLAGRLVAGGAHAADHVEADEPAAAVGRAGTALAEQDGLGTAGECERCGDEKRAKHVVPLVEAGRDRGYAPWRAATTSRPCYVPACASGRRPDAAPAPAARALTSW